MVSSVLNVNSEAEESRPQTSEYLFPQSTGTLIVLVTFQSLW